MNPSSGPANTRKTPTRGFDRAFWMCNIMEMWERLAYYGMRMVVPIYIMQADEPGGLHFTALQKGSIYFGWAIVQSLLPMFTGGYADRYGYKPTIAVSITIKILGYVLMATQRTYLGFYAGALILAAGTAIFKPGLQGSLAQTLHKGNSSVGWSIFYQIVNIGAWLGPFLAHYLKGIGWPAVFYGCAAIVALNYLMLLTYKEVSSWADTRHGFFKVFWVTLENIAPCWIRQKRFVWQMRLPILILILAGFWMMMYQIWDLHPNFVVDWVDSTRMVEDLRVFPDWFRNWLIEDTNRGVQVSQEQMINFNAFLVMIFVSAVGYAVAKMRRLTCMQFGILMATAGVLVSGWTTSGYVFLLGILFFSMGEMLTGPKKNEYFALIAPPGKKALYLGYVNIPIAIGQGFGAMIAGYAYGNYGEKAVLALKYLAQHTPTGQASGWDGTVGSLEATLNITRAEAFAELQNTLNLGATEATQLLWDTYHPQYVWIPFAMIGLGSAAAMFIFNRMSTKWDDMNV